MPDDEFINELKIRLEAAVEKSIQHQESHTPRPILNIATGLPATLLGFPIVVTAGEG